MMEKLLDEFVSKSKEILKENLISIYLHEKTHFFLDLKSQFVTLNESGNLIPGRGMKGLTKAEMIYKIYL